MVFARNWSEQASDVERMLSCSALAGGGNSCVVKRAWDRSRLALAHSPCSVDRLLSLKSRKTAGVVDCWRRRRIAEVTGMVTQMLAGDTVARSVAIGLETFEEYAGV